MQIHECDRCGFRTKPSSEHGAEVAFDQHECKGMRDLGELRPDLLKALAMREITEEEAWRQNDK